MKIPILTNVRAGPGLINVRAGPVARAREAAASRLAAATRHYSPRWTASPSAHVMAAAVPP